MRKLYTNNSSGCTGVNWSKDKNKWHAKIYLRGKRVHLGYFTSLEKAEYAFLKATIKREVRRKLRRKS